VKTRVQKKTSLVLESIGKAMNAPGGESFIATWVEAENSLTKEYVCDTFHIDPDRFYYIPIDSSMPAEKILDTLYEVMKGSEGAIDLVCINSLSAILPSQEAEASFEGATVAVQARLNSRIYRKFNALIAEFETAFILIGHLSTNIGTMSKDPLVLKGGQAIKHWSHLTLDLRKKSIGPGEPITKEEGVKIGVTIKKNHVRPEKFAYTKLEYYALFGEGVETIFSALNSGIEKGILEMKGAWIRQYNSDGEEVDKWNGKVAFREDMRNNPDKFEALTNLVYGGSELSSEEIEEIKAEEEALDELIEQAEKKTKRSSKKSHSSIREVTPVEEVSEAEDLAAAIAAEDVISADDN
jgi:recombination protein RecA